MVQARFKVTEVLRPLVALEATILRHTAITVALGASLPLGNPMADAGKAKEQLNSYDLKDDFDFLG